MGNLTAMAEQEPWTTSWTTSWVPGLAAHDVPTPLEAPSALDLPPSALDAPSAFDLPPVAPAPALRERPRERALEVRPAPPAETGPVPGAPAVTATEAFDASRRAPRQARAFVAAALHDARVGDPRILDVAQLLTSEITTRALQRDTGRPFLVAVTVDAAAVVVGLQDGAPHSPLPAPEPSGDWGATLVDALSDGWGATTGEHGRVFWFRLARR